MATHPAMSNTEEVKWVNLSYEVKAEVLNSKIACQGEQLTLRELTLDLLEELDLGIILKKETIEVVEPINKHHGYDERYYVHRTFLEKDRKRIKPFKEVFSTKTLHSEQLSAYKFVVIADAYATGKSTVLTNIALQFKEKNPGDLIFVVNLNKCSKPFHKMSFNNELDAARFFIDKLVQPKHPKIFKLLFETKRPVLFFDGSDDLDLGSLTSFNEMINLLTKRLVKQVWYTTKDPIMRTIDNKLVVSMKPFGQSDQVEFIVKYWQAHGRNTEDMLDIASEIILKQESVVEMEVRENIGALFMSQMLAEIFLPTNNNHLTADFDVCWIFEKFLEIKFDLLPDEKKPELVKQHKQALQYCAMNTTFRHTMKTLGYYDEFDSVRVSNDDLCRLQLVYPNGDSSMKFIHKTLMFYIVAEWFYDRYFAEFANPEFKKIYESDDNDNDQFLFQESFIIMKFINLIAHRKMFLITDKDISKLGSVIVAKQKKEKKEKRPNTLGKIFNHLCRDKFVGLFKVILKSFSQPTIVKFINKHFDEVLYDENNLNFILRFEHRNCFEQSERNAEFVFSMMEWAAKHLNEENKQKLFSVKNDSDKCPLFWVLRGEDSIKYNSNIVYETIKSLGTFYSAAFADDRDKFCSLLFASKSKKTRDSSQILKGDTLPDDVDQNSSIDHKAEDRRTIFFFAPFKYEVFRALFETCEEAFGKAKLIELLYHKNNGKVFTHSKILKATSADYQNIVYLLCSTLGQEEAFNQFVILENKVIASFCVLVKNATLEIFENGWKAMEQTFNDEKLRSMLIVETRIHTAVFMAAISNPNLEVFNSFLQMLIKLGNDDKELIDKTLKHLHLDTCMFSKSKPLMKAAKNHFDMAEFWKVLKNYVTDIKNLTNDVLYKSINNRNCLHIYIESHYYKNGFKDMFAKFWNTLIADLDSSTVDNLMKSNFLECFEYHTESSMHEIIEESDLDRLKVIVGSTQSNSCCVL